MTAMERAGTILLVMGTALLALAVCISLGALTDGGPGLLDSPSFDLFVAAFPGILGICLLLPGIYMVRQARSSREFSEAMQWKNRSLRGTVCDEAGSLIHRAIVDVFAGGQEEGDPVISMQTDEHGRFSADLPEGQYVLVVWAPEIGESSIQATVSGSTNNKGLHIKLSAAQAISEA
jgi:hypothetical protein